MNIKDCYVGHTTDFKSRKCLHKFTCNNVTRKGYNYYVYQFIRENGGWDNWAMIEIEKFNCKDRNEASARERHWIETLEATLNSNVPARTKQEYDKEYYDINKEQIKEYNLTSIECVICNCQITRCNRLRHEKSNKHIKNMEKQTELV